MNLPRRADEASKIMEIYPKVDRGRERLSPSPPSEPCVRFSRTRLSGRWFPHRDWLANPWIALMVNNPCAAKEISYLPPYDAVIQRRQHAVAPLRGFHSQPIPV